MQPDSFSEPPDPPTLLLILYLIPFTGYALSGELNTKLWFKIISDQALVYLSDPQTSSHLHSFLAAPFSVQNLLHKIKKEVIFMWLPGHVGILGNETANKIAKEALVQKKKKRQLISSLLQT